ncbi:CidB/LrgB family autolysis modulator [Bisgaard Taxon 10/6]|uniref:CidB/LrgB family autolysis modulator n=1 Tax=Exercitatus varius TaxID=67857 RepID=A0AAW6QBM3_9PAST|nr:CidB/LrgB family autolysis modulator [Exercitatus varius]QOF68421.1 CidB/LrgB family autolysis modulator [Actinobacillus sp. GY-402]MDG2914562.1 CidB/LrgB family autolysis modulator [Exercitatus varius]MDG2939025.1 CidB/LrgB family autolysis modulator [Exercitatus varius]MDG2941247.1 CidB/LrgB family autolysis modulator [Exercitatus varius]MDG2945778.1 CidB/LrgB family autolysis modulator [Exercitatus varius]
MIILFSLLTIAAFFVALQINKRLKSMLLNTFVLTVLILVGILLATDVPYDTYMKGNAPLNNLLGVSVVALALPLYEQLHQIAARWQAVLLTTLLASVLAMVSGAGAAMLLGANPEIVATVISKSVTTPIAMEVSKHLGGVPAVAAVGVILAGLQGSMFGYLIMKKLRIKNHEAIGLAVGSMSHALGTVSLMEVDPRAGSYSSISLVLCGIISSLLAPLVFNLIYFSL